MNVSKSMNHWIMNHSRFSAGEFLIRKVFLYSWNFSYISRIWN